MDYVVLDKYAVGHVSGGSNVGDAGRFLFLFGDDGLRWDENWLKKVPADPDLIEDLLQHVSNKRP